MRSIAMLDLRGEYALFREEIRAAVDPVLESQQFIGGPAVAEVEEAIRTRYGVAHAIAVGSGTDALLCTLMALGIGRDDEVIVPSFTFFATAGTVWRVGAKPVFVDIDPRTFNMDATKVEQAVTSKTRAIMAVHLFGQCADMDAINVVAARHGLKVIEDAAQAIGATYRGKKAGTMGIFGCFSFFPSKNLGGAGDGGFITTDDPALAERLTVLREHGSKPKYYHSVIGINSRLDALQAAIVLVKLPHLEKWHQGRRRNAAFYTGAFAGLPLATPFVREDCASIYNQYVVRTPRRDALREHLARKGIGNEVYYPVPLHLQKCYASLGQKAGAFPHSEAAAKETAALPIYSQLTEAQLSEVVAAVREFFA